MKRAARAIWLGRRAYGPVLALQEALHEARKRHEAEDAVLLVEHEPVITLGRNAQNENILLAREELVARGVDLFDIGRGGDVTYHGPGQLVGYPIIDLRPERCDVRRYVRDLAEVMIQIAGGYGVEAGTVDGMIGVWADAAAPDRWAGEPWAADIAKLGAIGVRLSRWVTLHGFALNVSTPLSAFAMIVPCGISEHDVASLESLGCAPPSVAEVAMSAAPHVARGLRLEVREVEDHAARPLADIASELGLSASLAEGNVDSRGVCVAVEAPQNEAGFGIIDAAAESDALRAHHESAT